MPSSKMQIQCPECAQNFDVNEEFLGKKVECGACKNRFDITEEMRVAKPQKYYPQGQANPKLQEFTKHLSHAVSTASTNQDVYTHGNDIRKVSPLRPRRKIAIGLGAGIFFFVLILFLLAGGSEGSMRDIENDKRFVLVGFSALLASCLFIFGMVKNRSKGILFAVLGSCILLGLPLVFPANPLKVSDAPFEKREEASAEIVTLSAEEIYEREVGYTPVASAIDKHSYKQVVALYLNNAPKRVRGIVTDYFEVLYNKKVEVISYARGEKGMKALLVLTGELPSIEEVEKQCEHFGRVKKTHESKRVIEIFVEAEKLGKMDLSKASDPKSLDFERQNLRALRGIDPTERKNAVHRLLAAKPRALRDDITQALFHLIKSSPQEEKMEILKAIALWSQEGSRSDRKVLKELKALPDEVDVDASVVEFIIKRKPEGYADYIIGLWQQEPALWSAALIAAGGKDIHAGLLHCAAQSDDAHLVSMAFILGKTGDVSLIPDIQKVQKTLSKEKSELLGKAIDTIMR